VSDHWLLYAEIIVMKLLSRWTLLTLGIVLPANCSIAAAEEKVNFEDHVKPILRDKCFSCHNTNKKTSDLDLSSFSSLMQGGASGAAIEPGNPSNSYLFRLMNHESEPFMPPNADKLPDAMLDTVRKWIESGAPETASSKVMLPKKPSTSLSVDVAAGVRPEGPAPMPDVLNLEPVVQTTMTTAVSAIATSPWAKLVAVAGQKQVVLYHSETMEPLGVLPFPEGQARVLKFSRNGQLLLAGGGHGAAKGLAVVWDVRTGERMMEIGDELDEVLAADISADQTLVAVGGPQKVVRVYSTQTKELVYEVKKHTDWIYSLEFSPDSVLLATSDRSGGLHVWESHTGREYLTLLGHTAAVYSVSWRIDGNVLASGSEDTTIRLWEMENGGQIKSWGAHGGGVFSIEFCRDGRLVSSGRDKVARLWNQEGGALLAFEAFNDLALQVSHCDETNRTIAGDWTGEVRVWNAADGARIGSLSTNPPTLETRVAQAEGLIAPAQQKLAETQAAYDAAVTAQTAQQQKTDAAGTAFAAAQKKVTDQQAAIVAAEQKLTADQQSETKLNESIAALQKVIPELRSAAEKAAVALESMKSDAELTKLTAKLKEQADAREVTLKEQEASLTTLSAAVQKLVTDVAAMKTQVAADEQAVVVAKTAVDTETAALTALQPLTAAAETNLNNSKAEIAKAEGLVFRWKNYVALRDELKLLDQAKKSRDEVQLKSLEAVAVVTEKQQAVATVDKARQDALTVMTQSAELATRLEAEMKAAEQKMTEQQLALAQLEKAQPMLKAAVTQTQAALALLPEDAEIKASAESLAAIADRSDKAAVTGKEQLAEMVKLMEKARLDRETADKARLTAQTQMEEAAKQVEAIKVETAPLEQAAQAAATELAAAEAKVQEALQIVETRRQQLRPVLQISQASAN
jgi:WD40 repeat protein